MLEDQVAYLLQRYLGNYVRGLNKEALKISVWQGDVELTNMQLKPEALNALKLPVKVKAGFLGSVRLKVPWSRLGQDPVLVHLDRIFLLAEPATQVEGRTEDAVQEAKKSRIREMELKFVEKAQQLKSEMNKSWLGSLINTIIGNLKLSISNIHIRYEDVESNPGHPFAAGLTLGKLSAVTVDDNGMETFVTGGTLDRIQKFAELDKLAFYLDSDISPWHISKPWEDLLPSEWVQVFRFGTNEGKPADRIMKKHSYILQPVSGSAIYSKLHSNQSANSNQPLQKAAVDLDDVTLCLSKDGYRDILKLADNFAAFNQRLKYAHYRPLVSVKSNPRAWWKYTYKAISDQMKKASGKLSWEQVLRYASLRKRYISLYASLLKNDPSRTTIDDNKEIEELDRELDIDLILQWRILAHKFVEKSMEADLNLRKQKTKTSWWSFGRNNQSFKNENEQFHFSDEDWEQLNKLIGYKEGEDGQSVIINEKPDTLHTSLEVHMKRNATKLADATQDCLAELSCNGLDCFIKLYPETKVFNLKLGSYQLSSPNGLLAQSATTSDSLVGVFCYKPFDAKVDWSMVAKASPCYMTYLKDSIGEIIKFFESNDAVSQTIALETAAAVQVCLLNSLRCDSQNLEIQNPLHRIPSFSHMIAYIRKWFLLDLDIAAPKITIPTEFRPNSIHSTKLLLDLGNLVIRSQDDYERRPSKELDMYLQFDLVLSDVSAFLVDGDFNWSQTPLNNSPNSTPSSGVCFLPVIDKCGVILRLQQIRLPNPSYPSTRLSVRLPSLGFHFSPARYHRLMQVLKIFQEESDNPELLRPWDQADFEGWLYLLIRKGVGNREAVWKRRYICLVGPFLYVLESPGSKSYKQYLSLRGKQVHNLPSELLGDVKHALAISDTGRPINKVVEDVNALILRCDSDELQRNWQSRLQGAIYRSSASAPIATLSETSSDPEDSETEAEKLDASSILKIEHVFVTGALDELKIRFNYNHQDEQSFVNVLLAEESRLFEFRAIGGQVELSIQGNDMLIGTVLKSLEIEDLVCCNVSQPCFLARSFVQSSDVDSASNHCRNLSSDTVTPNEGDDKFYEAPENLVDSEYISSESSLSFENPSCKPPSFSRIAGLLPDDTVQSRREGIEQMDTLDSFVKAQIVIYDQNSSLYDNVDTEVVVSLATLSFFCRRPTIVAIMEFVNAINAQDEKEDTSNDNSPSEEIPNDISEQDVVDDKDLTTIEEPALKGLLGKGKSRIVFNLVLKMARAQILLMNENETKLATLSQNKLLTDIKLVFTSFTVDDDDYEGYEYSLFGELSEVRIIYLNRFVQEIASYFMGLVPNDSKGAVKLKDQVTNSEKWFTASEIEGSPALKLDVSLKKPIILMPRRTDSPDYLKLDVVHITVQNAFQWVGGSKSEINAVRLEILTIQVEDINLNVGTGDELGESTIQDVKGISIVVQRSLRDLFHQVPSTETVIKMEELKASLTNREYQIITECAVSNMSETPNIVPPLNFGLVSSTTMVEPNVPQTPFPLVSETPGGAAWVSMKVSVAINLVELRLYGGLSRDASLATVQVTGAWLIYKSNNFGEGFLSSTLKGFTVIDDREGTHEQFKLAVGNPEKTDHDAFRSTINDEIQRMTDANKTAKYDIKPVPPMLILDAKFGQHLTSVTLCVQRPQLLVALDFLLAVVEFFVPSVGDLLSNDENINPILAVDAIVLDQPVYLQPCPEMSLTPLRPLIVDCERFDHFIYDGQGGTLYLKDRGEVNLTGPSKEAIIYVENGKTLQFKNISIKNGKYLDSCIFLGSNSAYSVSEDDMVYLEGEHDGLSGSNLGENSEELPPQEATVDRSTELIIELQAIGPELTFYSTSKDVGFSSTLSNKLLHAQLDAFARVVLKSNTTEMTASALGLTMESNGITILEPFDTSIKYSNASGKTNINVMVSDIFMNFTFSILRLFIAVEEDILGFLRTTSKKITISCSEFDKVGTIRNPNTDQIYAFWRPRAPPGFAVLGDYLTPLDKPPTKGVVALNTSFVRVKRPISFKLIWPALASKEISDEGPTNSTTNGVDSHEDSSCSIWFPEAPKGYVALGCVVSPGRTQPPLSSAFCILASLVSSCSLRDCITISSTHIYPSTLAFWRVDNSVGTFLPADPTDLSIIGAAYELRHIKYGFPEFSPKESSSLDVQPPSSSHVDMIQSEASGPVNSGRRFEAVASFQLIWWNQASNSRKKLSIWRPVVPQGMVYFGDIAVKGYEPPNTCIVLHDNGDGELFKAPLDFQIVGQIKKQRGMEGISFWMPQAPPGFVSLGCVACKGSPKQHDFSKLRCLRSDMVTQNQFLEESLWDTYDARSTREAFSIWSVDNELGSFIVRSGFKKPPRRFALKLADHSAQSGSDDTVIDAEIRTFSAAVFDDYGGLMVPLFNLSLTGIGFSLHGRTDYLNSTVSFSTVARSYNDKYETWEPLVEPVDGFLRYQYDLNAPGAASQLRVTATRDLNLNVSASNTNMIVQAYASWDSLSHAHENKKTKEAFSPTYGAGAMVDVHQKRNYYIIPQNKLGQDIFIRATEIRGLSNVIRMPSGGLKPVKVPVSKNMLDSHLKRTLASEVRTMVTVVILDAQLPRTGGLNSHLYTVAIRLSSNQGLDGESPLHQQSARTSGSIFKSFSSELELVSWSEVFFFKVDSPENYLLELLVTDVGKGDAVGFFSTPLSKIAGNIQESSYQVDYLNYLTSIDLSSAKSMSASQNDTQSERCGKIRCAVLLSSRAEAEETNQFLFGGRQSGFIQISPTMEGPWTSVRLNYAAPAACWRLGNDVVASEVSVRDGNISVDIRSLVSIRNNTDFTLDLCLVSKASNADGRSLDDESKPLRIDARKTQTGESFETQKRSATLGWVGSSNYSKSGACPQVISVGLLKPGDSVALPLAGLTQSADYVLQLRPACTPDEYSWSSMVDGAPQSEDCGRTQCSSGIGVSTLTEREELLYCTLTSSSTSNGSHKLWFCVSVQATEIAKDIRSDPIQDWSLVVKSPLSISNYLPLVAEYSVLDVQASGHFVARARGIFSPGKTVKIHTADIRRPLFFSLLPQKGWLPINEAVLISQPHGLPSKTISLRSSFSGRIVQLILEQNFDKDRPLMAKMIRVYAPYWFSIAKCPPLTLRLMDVSGKKHTRKLSLPFQSKKREDEIIGEISEEEIYQSHTIASAINFNMLGLSVSITHSGQEETFGPASDLSSLGDMDGSMDLYAYDADGNCMRLFISTKPCPYQSVPTKVISVRPFMTFTNRLGQDIFIKLSGEDNPKVLHAFDSRIAFLYRKASGTDKLQVRLEETEWSHPVQIAKEDTIFLVLRGKDGTHRFLRTEIRGFEEGSRFIVVFRIGSTDGPIRLENRTVDKTISICQSGFGEDAWIKLAPLSTKKFAWNDPYGSKFLDAKIDSNGKTADWKLNLESPEMSFAEDSETGLQFHVVEMGDIKVARFTNHRDPTSNEEIRTLRAVQNGGNSHMPNEMQNATTPMELVVELGAVGVSIIDHRPKELSYLYLERVFVSYSTGYDAGKTSRFKLILGYLQIDNQLPLTLMPVLLAPEKTSDIHHPVFKMTITMRNENTDGILVYPYVYIRVTEKVLRLNIHEPIIWALVDFYNNLQLDRLPQSSSVTQVDPEMRIGLIDVSEIRLKVALETAPDQRPHGVLGVWSLILSAVGNAMKIQVHMRRVMHRDRFMRKSSMVPAIGNRIWRDLIHNPLHLLFSVDVLGMASSTLASLGKGFAELSTDGQFLQLRSKLVGSRRITGVGDGLMQGTEALAHGVAFGVSGVVRKPVESARQNGLLGLAHGLGRAFIGFFVQPVSGALDFFSLAVDGIGASCSKCLEILNNKTATQRLRNPRAIHADGIVREYSEKEALGQMLLHLAEASRHLGCTEIFKEPSKYALTDYYEDHFIVPYQRIVLVTNKRVMLLQCQDMAKMDKKPSKILWDVPWEQLMALELAKAGCSQPSHLLLHLKTFRRSEKFVRVIKCHIEQESEGREPQAIRICSVVRRVWKAYQSDIKSLVLKVPSSQRHVYFAWSEASGRGSRSSNKAIIKLRDLSSLSSAVGEGRFVNHTINFRKIWSSEQEFKGRCKFCRKKVLGDGGVCSIWRPVCPDGYVSIGDIAHVGDHSPNVAAVYRKIDRLFADPVGYDLVWRNCSDDYKTPVSIWHPRAPEGYVSPGCVAVANFEEPEPNLVSCVAESLVEETEFEEVKVWSDPESYPWACHIYQVKSDALHFVALRQTKEDSDWKPMRVVDDPQPPLQSLESQ
ncbi:hypothetical protein Tsubulata_004613 [Turnera subulata]|uniref:PH domain-containing protein n=1 Tax=Turnera subulata TaxID=218843 RepID=A0A9Q0GBR1_9ROSI|nr:hypothetical protein Tsubulata_004613 [Turnera subulata]